MHQSVRILGKGLPLLRSFGRCVTEHKPCFKLRYDLTVLSTASQHLLGRGALLRLGVLSRSSSILTRSTLLDKQSQSQHVSTSSNIPLGGAPTFQEAISRLQQYWASVGCAMWLPHNTEVGAGTMNPATFLRVLGPEPWNVAYPEPSIRPDDSRYGHNPNRVQRHTQFQVILKPDPGDAQELYLGSLEALGINTKAHDVRFVEDNWESPVLGAWGLGWEVWLDGMEVTQFTYFQQAGGKPLDAPAVEITYGMERILMSLQGVKHFKDIVYAPSGITYGEMFLQNEYEQSVYNLDAADVSGQRQRFALYEKEARRLLSERLPIPAFDHLLKLSHAFNVLDARGAIGVTERADCFATLRSLAREVTGLWLARREELEHPLGVISPPMPPKPVAVGTPPTQPAAFVLELGSEELPPEDVMSAVSQMEQSIPAFLERLRLHYDGVEINGTPRRLSVVVSGLVDKQSDNSEKVRGPPVKVAYGASGAPTPALAGFCKKNGVTSEQCSIETDAKGVGYVWAGVHQIGRSASEVLAEELPTLLASISFKKSMRWRGDAFYSRPLRWLVAMHGEHTLPLTFAGLTAFPATRLLRNGQTPEQSLSSADSYLDVLRNGNIMICVENRKKAVWQGVMAAAAAINGTIPDSCQGDLLDEVANLVESPTVVVGHFDPKFLSLPQEVLVTVMRKHQRYFPVIDAAGKALLPAFVTVANGEIDEATVRGGNEAVLRARFEDAQFFFDEDRGTTLEEVRPRLAGTVFQKELGSLLDKSERVEKLIVPLAHLTNLSPAIGVATKAAHLGRADLATAMVTEMTELAGTMGRHYAILEGQEPSIAEAIFESVLPRNSGDALPESDPGLLASVADKLDSLAGLFAAGCGPTASADPYGLRRAAVGMLQAILHKNVHIDLARAVDAAADLQPIHVDEECRAKIVDFLVRRLEQLLIDGGVAVEAVRAALNERGNNPSGAASTAKEVGEEMKRGEGGRLHKIMTALARPVRLTRGKEIDESWSVDESLFECTEERNLWATYTQVRTALQRPDVSVGDFLVAAEALVEPLAGYFDKVFVMCEDTSVQQNRLATLRAVSSLPAGLLDFSELPGF